MEKLLQKPKHDLEFVGYVNKMIGAGDVWVEGKPLDPKNDLVNHSPDGFSWGYMGSGCSQLALAIMYAYFAEVARLDGLEPATIDRATKKVYQYFKRKFIAPLPQDRNFYLTAFEIYEWIQSEPEIKELLHG